jgi:hypothetical protein
MRIPINIEVTRTEIICCHRRGKFVEFVIWYRGRKSGGFDAVRHLPKLDLHLILVLDEYELETIDRISPHEITTFDPALIEIFRPGGAVENYKSPRLSVGYLSLKIVYACLKIIVGGLAKFIDLNGLWSVLSETFERKNNEQAKTSQLPANIQGSFQIVNEVLGIEHYQSRFKFYFIAAHVPTT